MIALAGVGSSANQAAADFIGEPKQLAAVLHTLPAGWERETVQIVLHTNIINDVPISTDVKAVSVE